MTPPTITETGIVLHPDSTRVVTRLFVPGREAVGPGESRAEPVIERILALSDEEASRAALQVEAQFRDRHPAFRDLVEEHVHEVVDRLAPRHPTRRAGDLSEELTGDRRFLLGACFTHEYAVEAAALCNPAIVVHPDQDGSGSTRFVISVRGIGEGHRSTIGFRTGTVTGLTVEDAVVTVDPPTAYAVASTPSDGPNDQSRADHDRAAHDTHGTEDHDPNVYVTGFSPDTHLSSRVLWPHVWAESSGMEDARFTLITDDDGTSTYIATYTGFDGVNICQRLLQTDDLVTFTSSPITGYAAVGKGLAIFPRRIGGQWAALSRSDRETNAVAFSNDLLHWPTRTIIQRPELSWELLQIGNCGSPIETENGWLVITHGVGPLRTYHLGALLLDLDDPTIVLARSMDPILSPGEHRRDGYVPNVVYTCGALAHGDVLVLPFGIGDQSIGIVTLSIAEIVASMEPVVRAAVD